MGLYKLGVKAFHGAGGMKGLGQKVKQAHEVYAQAQGIKSDFKKVGQEAREAIQHRDLTQAMGVLRHAETATSAARSTMENARKVIGMERTQGKKAKGNPMFHP